MNWTLPHDDLNLNIKSEKLFYADKRFWLPLYAYQLVETITWLWALVVMSDNVNINMLWFQMKPEGNFEYFMFCSTFGYFCALNGVNGHELLHKKEWYNKYLGVWSYTKFCMTHFLDEHIKGHHRYVATPEDPATAEKNESFYAFFIKSIIGSHRNVWNREVKRITKEQGKDVPFFLIVLNNKMTWFFVLHSSIFATIYFTLGWSSLQY